MGQWAGGIYSIDWGEGRGAYRRTAGCDAARSCLGAVGVIRRGFQGGGGRKG